MAGFDNRYGTEYGGLAAQMAGVESGRQGARTRRLGLEIESERFGRSMDQVERDAAAAAARAASASVGSQIDLARLMADQSQHNDKMGIDRARLGLDTKKAGFEMGKLEAETALLRQEFAGIEQVAQVANNPMVAALARAGQLDKAENVQRALLADAVSRGQVSEQDIALFNATQGKFIGENEGVSISDREAVAQRNMLNQMALEQVKGSGKSGGSAGKIPGGTGDPVRDLIKLWTGVDPVEDGNRSWGWGGLTGTADDKGTAYYDEWIALSPTKKAATIDAINAASTIEEQQKILDEAIGFNDKEFWSDRNPYNVWRILGGLVGPNEAMLDRETPSEDELATALESGKPEDMEILAQKYPAWYAERQADAAMKDGAKNRGVLENGFLNAGLLLQAMFAR